MRGSHGVLKLLFLCATIVGCVPPTVANAKSWLCVADKSTGFKEQAGTWQSVTFSTSTKIVIKPIDFSNKDAREVFDVFAKDLTDFEKQWFRSAWTELGNSYISGLCDAGLYENVINCKDGGTEPNETITVDLQAMRFQLYHPYGYLFPNKKYPMTPFIEIGTCSEL